MKVRLFQVILFSILVITGCRQEPGEVRTVDFSDGSSARPVTESDQNLRPLRVAVSAMSSPRETFSNYENIIRHIGSELDVPVEFHQRRTYSEINSMLESGQLDFAFICSGAYVELNPGEGIELMAVPVSHGKSYYQAYIIVPENSPARELSDLEGMTFAYTDILSNTGYLYALYRLGEEGYDPGNFFSTTVFTNAHDVSIQMVARGLIDGATVHGMVFDYLKANDPDRVQNIKIIEVSEEFGIPPVVASSRMGVDLIARVQNILFDMHNDADARTMMETLLIDKYVPGDDSKYDGIRRMKAAVGN